MQDRTSKPPFPDACRTGRIFLTLCCTAGVCEFRADGTLHLASHLAGHGWSAAWPGSIEDVNDDGTIVEVDGTERRIRRQGDREGRQASVHDPSNRSKAMRCDECKHWNPDGNDMKEVKGLGKCHKAVQLWDATEWTKDADGEDDCCGRTVKAGLAGQMSFVVDASQYHAALWTKPEFFCAHHEAAH